MIYLHLHFTAEHILRTYKISVNASFSMYQICIQPHTTVFWHPNKSFLGTCYVSSLANHEFGPFPMFAVGRAYVKTKQPSTGHGFLHTGTLIICAGQPSWPSFPSQQAISSHPQSLKTNLWIYKIRPLDKEILRFSSWRLYHFFLAIFETLGD